MATRKNWRADLNVAMLLVAAVATFLMLRFTAIFWRLLPKLRFVQFPWRWMAILAVACAFFQACAFRRARRRWIVVAMVATLSVATAALLIHQTWWDTEDIPVLRAAIRDGSGFDGTDEYDPLGDDHYDLPAQAPEAAILNAEDAEEPPPKANIRIEKWIASDKQLLVTSAEASRVALRLLDYPAWRVEVNGKPIAPQHPEGTAQMLVPLQPGTSQIRIHLVMTKDREAGAAITLLSLLAIVPLFLRVRRPPLKGRHALA